MQKEVERTHNDFPIVDSFSLKCLGQNPHDSLDIISEKSGTVIYKFHKYLNCSNSILDTFIIKNDTINFIIISKDKERLACDCFYNIFIRLKNISVAPKNILINGQIIEGDQKNADAREN